MNKPACLISAFLLLAHVCEAQDYRQRSRSEGRGGWNQQRSSPSPQDILSRLQRFEGILKQFDVNGDGTIQPGEVPADRRGIFARIAERSGLDPNHPISLTQFREAAIRRYSQGGPGGGGFGPPRGGGSAGRPFPGAGGMPGGSPGWGPPGGGGMMGGPAMGPPGMAGGMPPGTSPDPSGAPGFTMSSPTASFAPPSGTAANLPGAVSGSPATPGSYGSAMVGPAAGAAAAGASPAPGAVSPQPMDAEMLLRCQYYARSLIGSLDANRNGILEREEWSRGSPALKSADRNGDGKITLEELTAWVVESVQKGTLGALPSRFYRALTPAERFPEGLPEWFARKDVDGDGQISMAEFSNTWTEETASEFAKHDLNNDGYITPDECLEAMRPPQ